MEEVLNQIEQFTQKEKFRKFLVGCLVFMFIFFFQIFFLVKDFNILYIISKVVVGTLSSVVFIVYFIKVIVTRRLPQYSWYLIFIFVALVTVSTASSNIFFNQPIMMGIISQVKLTGVFYYFFMFAILRGFKVTMKELETAFLWSGLLFLFVYIGINLALNPQKYYSKTSTIVIFDSKGFRFRLPDVFISILTFYSFRSFLEKFRFVMLAVFLASLAYVLVYADERAYELCVLGVLGFTVFYKSNVAIKITLVGMGFVVLVWLLSGGFEYIVGSTDTTSLQIRFITTTAAYNFISSAPSHFIFGGGNLNELWLNGFARLYGQSFFLSDIGWIGICYEFGLFGVLICLSLYIVLIVELNKALKPKKTLLILALRDYLFMRFVLSILSPAIPYYIGIFTSILAICIYVRYYIAPFKATAL